jgi:hypothetical protein
MCCLTRGPFPLCISATMPLAMSQLRESLNGRHWSDPAPAAGERKWLVAYAPLSYIYRVALSCTLVLWLGGRRRGTPSW